jgi:hypothetical protein
MKKWVKSDSQFATGSSGRVSANVNAQRASAEPTAKQQRQANPKCRADKAVLRDKPTKRR